MKKKRLISIITAFVIIFCTCSVNAEFIDTQYSNYKDEISFVTQLGIMNGCTEKLFEPNNELSRAEFLILLMRATKSNESLALPEETVVDDGLVRNTEAYHYDDVSSSYVAAYIDGAYRMGIVDETDGTSFRPNDPVTGFEAVKWAVKALGYASVMKDTSNEYAFYKMGMQLGITKGLESYLNTALTRSAGAKLIFNMMNVEFCSVLTTSDGLFISPIKEGATLMNDVYKLKSIKGVVRSYNGLSIDSGINAAEGKIFIDNESYANGTKNLEYLLGCEVTAYYDEDSTILAMIEEDNEILTINAEDIERFDTELCRYEYSVDNRVKNVKISEDAYVMYNGKNIVDLNEELMNPKIGCIRLVDNDRDGKYNIISVTSIENYYVGIINRTSYTIYDCNGKSIVLDEKEADIVQIYDEKGNLTNFDGIQIGQILSVEESYGDTDKIIKAHICTEKITGMISSQRIEDESYYVTVKDVEYRIDMDSVKSDDVIGKELAGINVTLLLDSYNNAAWVIVTDAEMYAYLIKGSYDEDNEKVTMKVMLVDSGIIETYDVAEKIKVNSTSNVKPKDILGSSLLFYTEYSGNKAKQQLIKLRFNANGEITTILTAQDNTELNPSTYIGYDIDNFSLDYRGEKARYGYTDNFGDKYTLTAKTKIIRVPECNPEKDIYYTDDDYFKAITKSTFKENTSYNVAVYDVIKSREASVVIYYNTSTIGGRVGYTYNKCILAAKTGYMINKDEEIVKYVEYYDDNGNLTRAAFVEEAVDIAGEPGTESNVRVHQYFKDKYTPEDIEVGFAFVPNFDTNGDIENFRVCFDPNLAYDEFGNLNYIEGGERDDTRKVYEIEANDYARYIVAYSVGEVIDVEPGVSFVFNAHKDGDSFDYSYNRTITKQRYLVKAFKCQIIEDGKVTMGTFEDICPGDKIFMRAFRGEAHEAIILR